MLQKKTKVFVRILQNVQNPTILQDSHIDRGAVRSEFAHNTKVHWGGMIKDGKLYGDNAMGKYMMEVRTLLKNETL